jgi:hypothetical protein
LISLQNENREVARREKEKEKEKSGDNEKANQIAQKYVRYKYNKLASFWLFFVPFPFAFPLQLLENHRKEEVVITLQESERLKLRER